MIFPAVQWTLRMTCSFHPCGLKLYQIKWIKGMLSVRQQDFHVPGLFSSWAALAARPYRWLFYLLQREKLIPRLIWGQFGQKAELNASRQNYSEWGFDHIYSTHSIKGKLIHLSSIPRTHTKKKEKSRVEEEERERRRKLDMLLLVFNPRTGEGETSGSLVLTTHPS